MIGKRKSTKYKMLILFYIIAVCFYNACCNANELNKQAWIDLPNEPMSFYVSERNLVFDRVNMLIEQYHQMDKSETRLLHNRSEMLEKIAQELDLISSEIETHEKQTIISLALIAHKKAWYLEKLKVIYENNFDQYPNIQTSPNVCDESNCYIVLPLLNRVFYNTKYPRYCGMSYLEILDPCHRILTPYYVRWKTTNTKTPFFMWLEMQEIPHTMAQIEIFDKERLNEFTYKVSKTDHLLYDSHNNLANLINPDSEYLYIITMDKRIVIKEGNEYIKHISLSGGEPVLGSGTIKVLNGKIIHLDVESGHYRPTPLNMKQVIDILNDLGAIIKESDITNIMK